MEILECDYMVQNTARLARVFDGVYSNRRIPDVTKLDNVKYAEVNDIYIDFKNVTPEAARHMDPKVVKFATALAVFYPEATVGIVNNATADVVLKTEDETALIKRFDQNQKVTVSKKVMETLENHNAELYKVITTYENYNKRESEDGLVTVIGLDKFENQISAAVLKGLVGKDNNEKINKIRQTFFGLYACELPYEYKIKEENTSDLLDVLSSATYRLWNGDEMASVLLEVSKSNLSDDGKINIIAFLLSAFPENIRNYGLGCPTED